MLNILFIIPQALDPYDKKLHTDTWYYAKRCFLALAENMSKHMLILKVLYWCDCC